MSSGFTITEREIRGRVLELARRISEDFAGEEVLFVGVLKGAFMFLADLVRAVSVPCKVDFVWVSSYGDASRPGELALLVDLSEDVRGKNVVLVEDIVDTGRTLRFLLEHLRSKGPKSLKVCALLDKRPRREVDVPIDYVGFVVPDVFLIGYGLDYAGRGRCMGRVEGTEVND